MKTTLISVTYGESKRFGERKLSVTQTVELVDGDSEREARLLILGELKSFVRTELENGQTGTTPTK